MNRRRFSAVVSLLSLAGLTFAEESFGQEKPAVTRRRTTDAARPSLGLTPLTEMSTKEKYKGQEGGLYGAGQNEPPKEHLAAALRQAAKIGPLDTHGEPSDGGKIGMISVGMSNTSQEFSRFLHKARNDRAVSSRLVLVDGAQGGQEASGWAEGGRRGHDPWPELDRRLEKAGVSAAQVQVTWIKQARAVPSALGEFPKHAQALKNNLVTIVQKLQQRFPNLRLVYLSSRIYGGNATSNLNPEPYAYESAYAVRWVVQEQIRGLASLNYDPTRGDVQAPLILWGPYLWADGTTPRQSDGLVWNREDLGKDGTHPSQVGKEKVAQLLLRFFKEDPSAKGWFLA